MPEGGEQQQRRADDEGGEGEAQLDCAEPFEQIRECPQHISQRRDEQRPAVDRQGGKAERDIDEQHDHRLERRRRTVGEAEQREDRVNDQRRRQQVQPEGDIRAARLAPRIGGVPPHGEEEDADAEQQRERRGDGRFLHREVDKRMGSHQEDGGEQQREAEQYVAQRLRVADDGGDDGERDADDRRRSGRHRDGHAEAAPVDPGRCRRDRGRTGDDERRQTFIVLECRFPDYQAGRRRDGDEQAADEGEQQNDAGERHSTLEGEELRQAPGGGRDEQAG